MKPKSRSSEQDDLLRPRLRIFAAPPQGSFELKLTAIFHGISREQLCAAR
jgi:hypothetical protein